MSGRSIPALLVALLLGGTTACGAGSGGEPATSPSPKAHRTIVVPTPDPLPRGVHLSFIQQRIDEGTRRSQVRVINGNDTPVHVRSVGVDWAGYPLRCTAWTTTCPASRSSTFATSCPGPTARLAAGARADPRRRRDPERAHSGSRWQPTAGGSSTGSGAPSAPRAGSPAPCPSATATPGRSRAPAHAACCTARCVLTRGHGDEPIAVDAGRGIGAVRPETSGDTVLASGAHARGGPGRRRHRRALRLARTRPEHPDVPVPGVLPARRRGSRRAPRRTDAPAAGPAAGVSGPGLRRRSSP